MAQLNNSDRDLKHLKDRMSRMSSEEITSLNQQALITLLFIYSNGVYKYSDKDIEMYPGLAEQNRIVHETVGDYLILDLLKHNGYIEGESGRQSRWSKIFLTDKGLEQAKQLHRNFVATIAKRAEAVDLSIDIMHSTS
jgi:hypothetical protein